jgi:hypothetical protein
MPRFQLPYQTRLECASARLYGLAARAVPTKENQELAGSGVKLWKDLPYLRKPSIPFGRTRKNRGQKLERADRLAGACAEPQAHRPLWISQSGLEPGPLQSCSRRIDRFAGPIIFPAYLSKFTEVAAGRNRLWFDRRVGPTVIVSSAYAGPAPIGAQGKKRTARSAGDSAEPFRESSGPDLTRILYTLATIGCCHNA